MAGGVPCQPVEGDCWHFEIIDLGEKFRITRWNNDLGFVGESMLKARKEVDYAPEHHMDKE